MYVICLDLEGVLVPEIWVAFAEKSGIPKLKKTTRDEPDYDKLMAWRLDVLREHGLGLREIEETIDEMCIRDRHRADRPARTDGRRRQARFSAGRFLSDRHGAARVSDRRAAS